MKELLIATKNKHKIIEYKAMLEPLGFHILTLFDYPDMGDILETGTTFEANALLKAKTLAKRTHKAVVADDSGLVVTALDGAPGVYSARYARAGATDQDNNEKLIQEMHDKPNKNAYFITIICLYQTGEEPRFFEGRLHGSIATEYKGNHGFGYDPIFALDDGRHLAELSLDEKNRISHRSRALASFVRYIQTQGGVL
jgi:XTP/dITP diphosphohydrolase